MSSQAQIQANRRNAQKSTGPKTEQGKSIVAQNAITHGLRSARILIASEDPTEFDAHQNALLEDLVPVGPMESILVDRIVTPTWQLNRAARLQTCTLNTLINKQDDQKQEKTKLRPMDYLDGDLMDELGISEQEHNEITETKGYAELERIVDDRIRERQLQGLFSEDPAHRGDKTLGEVIYADFSQSRALERLVMYERRIENSLFRTHLELERLQFRRQKKESANLKTED